MSGTEASPEIGSPAKISEQAFKVGIGVFLGIALVAAAGRTFARIYRFHRVLLDDLFFYLATVALIAGTGLTYADIPLIYLQVNVQAGLQSPPADLVQQLIHSLKIQHAATVLLVTTVFSIKASFLFFFRFLIRHQKHLMIWWWIVFALLVPIAFVVTFSNFIACDYLDERIFGKLDANKTLEEDALLIGRLSSVKCVTPSALSRQNSIFKASGILDIITDAMLISIPILLLWNVQMSIRRKLALIGILCLSIFMILIAIIRIAAGNISHGQVDAAWAIFWLQVEACVGVMVVSVSAFRALFVAHKASKYNGRSPGNTRVAPSASGIGSHARRLWPQKLKPSLTGSQGRSGRNVELPAAPSPVYTGVRTHIRPSPLGGSSFDDGRSRSGDMELPIQGSGIFVRQDISSDEKVSYSKVCS